MLIGRPRPKGRRHDDICLRVSCSRLGGGHALVTLGDFVQEIPILLRFLGLL